MNNAIRLLAWIVALMLVALPLIAILNGWLAADRWPMQRLRLTAEYQRVSAEQVRSVVSPHMGRGFFALDPGEVQRAVMQLPWVDAVQVRKRWPDLIEITIREHRVFARWGEDRLLSDEGDVFSAPGASELQGLPRLDGPDSRVADVVTLYAMVQRVFSGTQLAVVGVRLSARGSWTLTLADGARVILGRADPEPRLQRLVRLLPRLRSIEPRAFDRIDLRYTNGFAVRWIAPDTNANPATAGAPLVTQQAGA